MNLPTEYADYMKKLLGNDYESYVSSFNSPSYHGLRVNRLKYTGDFSVISPFELTKIPYIDNGYIYDNKENPAKDVYYYAGLYYLQEPSAMLPANRLPVNESDRVLDLCAAPGGKATELAGKLNGSGLLYANDISASRAMALLKNLELAGAPNIYVTAESPENLAAKLPGFFDKILCDVPCSGEGMFRKDSSLVKSWTQRGPEYYQQVQRQIMDSAYLMLSEGGMIMYSTCTFNVSEDEENIAYFLEKYSDMELMDIEGYEGFSEGLLGLPKCVRVYPHKMIGEGHFLALMRKKISDKNNQDGVKKPNENIKAKIISVKGKDKRNVTNYSLPALKDNGYREGIRYLRTGLMLDESQAYAMTRNIENAERYISFSRKDIRVLKYLKGETLFLEEDERIEKGMVLIMVDGYPLGYAKHDGTLKLKNMYNPGWRIR